MTRTLPPQNHPTPDFAPGTLGRFLAQGDAGWPSEFTAEVGDATVRVGSSRLRIERQPGCAQSPAGCAKVRIALELVVEQGQERFSRPVEDLFPAQSLDALDALMDEQAPARVRAALHDVLVALCPEDPAGHLSHDPIAPMRLYEPVLEALAAPADQRSMAGWLRERLPQLLLGQGPVASARLGELEASVEAVELEVKGGLRARGEVKLMALVQLARGGQVCGSWRGRAVLMAPMARFERVEAPAPEEQAAMAGVIEEWREELSQRLASALASGCATIRPCQIMPERPLCGRLVRLLDARHAP